jgi:argininosuccinate lyase
MTSKELGFEKPILNSLYAQMTRGKYEATIMNLLTQLMFTTNKFASDMMMFTMSEFNYFGLPKEMTTGSSIMPQKKNMDLIELLRAKYSIIIGEEVKVKTLISNLISGYNRDVQLLKEPIMNSFEIVQESLNIMNLIVSNLKCNEEVCKKALTKELYATEEAYKLVKEGVPFREAYKKIGEKYE